MNVFDVTTTATIRPELLEKTYQSFFQGMDIKKYNPRLILNIDPVGEKDKTPQDILKVAKKYFKSILYRISRKPSYPGAVIWCWSHVKSDLVFHLEDDWELLRPINIDLLLDTIQAYPEYSSICLSKKRFPKPKGKKTPQVIEIPRIGLPPNFIRKSYIDDVLPNLQTDQHLEVQLWMGHSRNGELNRNFSHAAYIREGLQPCVYHTGPGWMKQNGYKHKPKMVEWTKTANE